MTVFNWTNPTFSECKWKLQKKLSTISLLFFFKYDDWARKHTKNELNQDEKLKNENDSKWMCCRVKDHRIMCIRTESAPQFKFRIHIVYDWCATLIWQISLQMYKNVCVNVCLCWNVCALSIFSFVYRLSDHCYIKHIIKSKFRVSFHREQMLAT